MSRPVFTLTEAAALVSTSRSTLRRRLDQGDFPDAYRDPKGVWKIPLTSLLAAGLHPVQGAVQNLSTDTAQHVHDIAQPEQVGLKNRVIELENALSIERAHRTAAEQVAAAERHRAQTAEMALRMLEQGPSAPAPAFSAPVATPPPEPRSGFWRRIFKT
ncbi:AlpA family transcriptional regulator [Arthrobacter sp. B1805]|uniref:helix-turn-helix transcriptional regulator n=1 Tax=Arthrobacter sp. B1805 TaxID=2058892 RepID=UPI0011B05E5D|nr:helix-turn-helix domain-containing protein [Arthrobacter sp. B1805]